MAKGRKRKISAGDIASNRQASFRYELPDQLECGIVLLGTEVKSLRDGQAQLKDGFALDPRRRAVAAQRPHRALRPRRPRQPRARAHAQAAGQALRDRAADGQDQGARADARPDAHLLQGPAREGRDRPRPRQGPLRQARVDQAPRVRARHAARAARSAPLSRAHQYGGAHAQGSDARSLRGRARHARRRAGRHRHHRKDAVAVRRPELHAERRGEVAVSTTPTCSRRARTTSPPRSKGSTASRCSCRRPAVTAISPRSRARRS